MTSWMSGFGAQVAHLLEKYIAKNAQAICG
jgi:hypothetical protein